MELRKVAQERERDEERQDRRERNIPFCRTTAAGTCGSLLDIGCRRAHIRFVPGK